MTILEMTYLMPHGNMPLTAMMLLMHGQYGILRLESIINHHAPIKSKRIRGNALPWLHWEIIQLMRQRDRAHKIAKRSGSQNNWDVYKKLRNSVTEQIRSKKSEHFTSTIEENKGNSSAMWKKLNEVFPNKQKIVANSLLSQHGVVVDDLADIADIFNEPFSTVGGNG